MKKLFSLLTLALLTMSAWAATTVTIDFSQQGYGNAEEVTELTIQPVTVTLDQGNNANNSPKYYTTGSGVRLYVDNTLTLTSAGDNITKAVFTFSANNYTFGANATVSSGTLDTEGSVTTWTGDAESFTVINGQTCRLQKIEVTLGEGGETPVDPEPEPKTYKKVTSVDELVEGQKYIMVYEGSPSAVMGTIVNYGASVTASVSNSTVTTKDAVELTLAGQEGAWTFATADGKYIAWNSGNTLNLNDEADEKSQWTVTEKENSGFILTNVGTTDRILQYNSGSPRFACYTGSQKDAVLYILDENATPIEAETAESLEIANDLGDGKNFNFTGSAVVTAQKGSYLWLRDDTGYGLIYGSINDGDNPTFENGTILAAGWNATVQNHNDLIEFVGATGVEASEETDPQTAAIQTITALDADMINAYVQVLNVKSFTVNGRNVTANIADGTTMAMYQTFNDVTIPNFPGNYTVEGAVNIYDGTLQLIIINITGDPDPVTTYDFYLVEDASDLKDGDKIILVGSHEEKFYALNKLLSTNFDAIEVERNEENGMITTGFANIITLEANGDYWNFKTDNGYLYAASSESNHMKLEDEVDADGNANALIYMDTDSMSISFQGTNTRNYLRFNYNNGAPRFSCYAVTSSVKTPAYIYKMVTDEPQVMRGDVNDDKAVTIGDVTDLIDYLLSGNDEGINLQNANCNLDEGVTISDVTALIDFLLSGQW
jgi:hypothetical protein